MMMCAETMRKKDIATFFNNNDLSAYIFAVTGHYGTASKDMPKMAL
jgi:hypothetical protein